MLDADEARNRYVQLLTEKVRQDRYPSGMHMDRIEAALTPETAGDYLEMLMEKIANDKFASPTMLARIENVAGQLPRRRRRQLEDRRGRDEDDDEWVPRRSRRRVGGTAVPAGPTAPAVRIVTWNVAGRARLQPQQAALIARCDADIVALQEVTRRTLPLWRAAFAEIGFPACECALDAVGAAPGRRVLGVLIAARAPLRRLPSPPGVPWPERVLCGVTGAVEVVNVHSPIAPAPGLAKVRTHEAVAAYLAERDGTPVILCGDLNTPAESWPTARSSASPTTAPGGSARSAGRAGTAPNERSSPACGAT